MTCLRRCLSAEDLPYFRRTRCPRENKLMRSYPLSSWSRANQQACSHSPEAPQASQRLGDKFVAVSVKGHSFRSLLVCHLDCCSCRADKRCPPPSKMPCSLGVSEGDIQQEPRLCLKSAPVASPRLREGLVRSMRKFPSDMKGEPSPTA